MLPAHDLLNLLELLGSGVSAPEVLEYLRATAASSTHGPNAVSRLINEDLRALAEPFPDMLLRDAMKWSVLAVRLGRDVVLLVQEWSRLDEFLVEHRLLYAAAGLTPSEVAAGVVSVDQAAVMVALRS